jgi:hypothetical protein
MTNHLPFLSVIVVAAALSILVSSTEAFTATSFRGQTRRLQLPLSQNHARESLSSRQPQESVSLHLFPSWGNTYEENRLTRYSSLEFSNNPDGDENENDESSNENGGGDRFRVDALVQLVSMRMRRVSFLSWWAQVILTTVSAVTLLFTKNVLNLEANPSNKAFLPNYFLAGSSISLSLGSVFWTWATRRLSRRLLRKPTTRIQAANMLRKSIAVGTCLNLMGMALAIVGAEQIIGGLAIKVLTTSASSPAIYQSAQSASLLQPIDILVVQANTNTLFSHFCSIVAYLFLGRSIGQLDPPSVEQDERPRA